jgi:hypothetical protein
LRGVEAVHARKMSLKEDNDLNWVLEDIISMLEIL